MLQLNSAFNTCPHAAATNMTEIDLVCNPSRRAVIVYGLPSLLFVNLQFSQFGIELSHDFIWVGRCMKAYSKSGLLIVFVLSISACAFTGDVSSEKPEKDGEHYGLDGYSKHVREEEKQRAEHRQAICQQRLFELLNKTSVSKKNVEEIKKSIPECDHRM